MNHRSNALPLVLACSLACAGLSAGAAEESLYLFNRAPLATKPYAELPLGTIKPEGWLRDELQTKIWPPMQTRDGRTVRSGPAATPGPEDSYVGYGGGWANVRNTPFRGYKHDALEGGISTPFIVHWPAGIPAARRNAVVNAPAHLIDLMATCVDVANVTYPKQFKGEPIQPVEGVSLVPAFRGEDLQRSAPLGFEPHGNSALRDGKWKIVSEGRANQPAKWELYDLDADRTELHDLAAAQPDKVKELAAKWEAWAERAHVKPYPNEGKDKKKGKGKKGIGKAGEATT